MASQLQGLRESKSALRGFAKQYTFDGSEGIDVMSYLNQVQPHVIDLLSNNRQIKFNLILTCTMERVDITTGKCILRMPHFFPKRK